MQPQPRILLEALPGRSVSHSPPRAGAAEGASASAARVHRGRRNRGCGHCLSWLGGRGLGCLRLSHEEQLYRGLSSSQPNITVTLSFKLGRETHPLSTLAEATSEAALALPSSCRRAATFTVSPKYAIWRLLLPHSLTTTAPACNAAENWGTTPNSRW
jgi:hypothetical protein